MTNNLNMHFFSINAFFFPFTQPLQKHPPCSHWNHVLLAPKTWSQLAVSQLTFHLQLWPTNGGKQMEPTLLTLFSILLHEKAIITLQSVRYGWGERSGQPTQSHPTHVWQTFQVNLVDKPKSNQKVSRKMLPVFYYLAVVSLLFYNNFKHIKIRSVATSAF